MDVELGNAAEVRIVRLIALVVLDDATTAAYVLLCVDLSSQKISSL